MYRLFLPEKFFCFSISKTVLQWLQWLSKDYYLHIPTLLDDIFVTKRCYNAVTAVTKYYYSLIPTLINDNFVTKSCYNVVTMWLQWLQNTIIGLYQHF